jgi:hypothetical protein
VIPWVIPQLNRHDRHAMLAGNGIKVQGCAPAGATNRFVQVMSGALASSLLKLASTGPGAA